MGNLLAEAKVLKTPRLLTLSHGMYHCEAIFKTGKSSISFPRTSLFCCSNNFNFIDVIFYTGIPFLNS